MKPIFLPAVDLEDVRLWMADGERYRPRVPECTERYLRFFRERGVRATFFVVGEVAQRHPDLIGRIAAEGHEVASHSMKHVPLNRLTPREFVEDTSRSIEAIRRAGVTEVRGYRAPIFSLTARTSWAHAELARLGIRYSSSVLPAPNPLYGWPEFGADPRECSGVLEIPMQVDGPLGMRLPYAGGVYFRVLPYPLIRRLIRRHPGDPDRPVPGYFHPYDIDVDQERFMHPGINDNPVYNRLMYWGRKNVFRKLDAFLSEVRTMTCSEYAAARSQAALPRAAS